MNNSTASSKTKKEAQSALDRFKMEVASEIGVNLKEGYNGDLTSAEAGSVGGNMVKKMIKRQEEQMSQGNTPPPPPASCETGPARWLAHQIRSAAVPMQSQRRRPPAAFVPRTAPWDGAHDMGAGPSQPVPPPPLPDLLYSYSGIVHPARFL